MRKCYSVSRSPIDENNDSVSKSWIVFRHGIVAKLTSAAEFFAAEYLAYFYSDFSSPQLLRGAPDYSIDTVELTRQNTTGNCELKTCQRSLRGGWYTDISPRAFPPGFPPDE